MKETWQHVTATTCYPATQNDLKQQWQPLTVLCHQAQNHMQTLIIINLNWSELQAMIHNTATTISATATHWEQRESKRLRKKGQDRTNKQQKWCHMYWQRRQVKADMMRFVRKGDRESERKRQSKWGKRRPWENDQGDRESLVRVDSAVVSWQCQLDSRDVFSRHWLLRTWPLCVEPEQTKSPQRGGGDCGGER